MILDFRFCGFVAGFSGVLVRNSLIINTIHFSGGYAVAGWFFV
jgi:hypothetical protein